jgi:hypothetical protein
MTYVKSASAAFRDSLAARRRGSERCGTQRRDYIEEICEELCQIEERRSATRRDKALAQEERLAQRRPQERGAENRRAETAQECRQEIPSKKIAWHVDEKGRSSPGRDASGRSNH